MLFHRAQVAFYTLLVEGLIRYWTRRGIIDKRKVLVRVSNFGSIWHMDDNANAVEDGTYLEDDFRLQSYQYMVKEFMTNELLEFPKKWFQNIEIRQTFTCILNVNNVIICHIASKVLI